RRPGQRLLAHILRPSKHHLHTPSLLHKPLPQPLRQYPPTPTPGDRIGENNHPLTHKPFVAPSLRPVDSSVSTNYQYPIQPISSSRSSLTLPGTISELTVPSIHEGRAE